MASRNCHLKSLIARHAAHAAAGGVSIFLDRDPIAISPTPSSTRDAAGAGTTRRHGGGAGDSCRRSGLAALGVFLRDRTEPDSPFCRAAAAAAIWGLQVSRCP
jgi:hypothetical protein